MGRRGTGDWKVRFRVTPSPIEIARKLGGLGEEFKDWKPAFQIIAARLATGIRSIISSRGANIIGDHPWGRPLDVKYATRKQKKGYSAAELMATGRMLAAATSPIAGIISLRKSLMKFGVKPMESVKFGKKQTRSNPRAVQYGSPKKNIQPRWFIGWTDKMRQDTTEILHQHAAILLSRACAKLGR